jgi:NAD(P)H-dependent flavin oxidoreductase YrpB (nitropropane dioxygenase family)
VTRSIQLKGCGIMSAAMDTVTEKDLALAMAKMGGMGILHRNLSPEEQAEQLHWVRKKIHFGGMIDKPISFGPKTRFSEFQKAVSASGWPFTSFPVLDETKKMLGLITRDRLEFVDGDNNPMLSEIMMVTTRAVTPFCRCFLYLNHADFLNRKCQSLVHNPPLTPPPSPPLSRSRTW